MNVKIISFGFKFGLPPDADYVFDMRFLKNPYFQNTLKDKTGLDKAVKKFVLVQNEAKIFAKL